MQTHPLTVRSRDYGFSAPPGRSRWKIIKPCFGKARPRGVVGSLEAPAGFFGGAHISPMQSRFGGRRRPLPNTSFDLDLRVQDPKLLGLKHVTLSSAQLLSMNT